MSFALPPVGFGPGSQPDPDDAELAYMAMPSGMRTFALHLPEIDDADAARPALDVLSRLADACDEAAAGGRPAAVPLDGLDARTRALVAETLGEGEVSCVMAGEPPLAAQESVFAGVWRVREAGSERIEVGRIPDAVAARAHAAVRPAAPTAPLAEGLMAAPALVAELLDRSASHDPSGLAHVVNLTLLPHTPQDLAHLDLALGEGSARLLSRGYGNCRVEATAVPMVWRVRFFNSMDALILDTIEVSATPEVALAAAEDLTDSAGRLREAVDALR
jgi:hydrogenase-1 operon protein HyaF